jgi:predicted metal-dependent phosphotriesterase family hydrolase
MVKGCAAPPPTHTHTTHTRTHLRQVAPVIDAPVVTQEVVLGHLDLDLGGAGVQVLECVCVCVSG